MKTFSKLVVITLLSLAPLFTNAQNKINHSKYLFDRVTYQGKDTLKYEDYTFNYNSIADLKLAINEYGDFLCLKNIEKLNHKKVIEMSLKELDKNEDKYLNLISEIQPFLESAIRKKKGAIINLKGDL
ncbi:MAG: hypothetical protein U9Q99_00075 [Nanoarchaeota archaeon]|nr:hypothetical protein [Nanoarchaeota archaeon]